jgi:hypothetical protein
MPRQPVVLEHLCHELAVKDGPFHAGGRRVFLQIVSQFFGDMHRAATRHAGNGDGTPDNLRGRLGRRRGLAVDEGETTVNACVNHKSPRGSDLLYACIRQKRKWQDAILKKLIECLS